MAIVSARVFSQTLRPLLKEVQFASLAGLLQRPTPDLEAIGKELCRKGWLTPFQARELLLGKGSGLLLGPYTLLDLLGSGGRGHVFKAHHRAMNRLIALKLLHPDLLSDQEAVHRFFREVEVTSQFSHPAIVHAYDAGVVGKTYYLAMEYVDGLDLERLVQQQGPVPVTQACDFIRQAADGLQYAHQRGLVHRDIKPSNLLLTPGTDRAARSRGPDGQVVKILDLGLARLRQPMEGSRTKNLTVLSGTSVMQGTPDYMSPEQALDFHRADIRSDIYSLGCTLHFLLTGQPPFAGVTLAEKLIQHQQAEPTPVETLVKDCPAAVGPIVRKMMAKPSAERYQTPGQVAEALGAAIASWGSATGSRTQFRDADSTVEMQYGLPPITKFGDSDSHPKAVKRGRLFRILSLLWSTSARLLRWRRLLGGVVVLLVGTALLFWAFHSVERRNRPSLLLSGNETIPLPNDLLRGASRLSVEAWFKTKSGGVLLGYQLGPYPTGGGNYVPILYVGTDGLLRAEFWTGGGTPITSKMPVNDDDWHHVCLVADSPAKIQSLFLDGVLVGNMHGELNHLNMADNQAGMGLTTNWPKGKGGWFGFAGTLAELRLWHRPLTPAEVQTHREKTLTGNEPDLVLYLPLDESEGNTLADHSRDGHKVQLVTGPNGQVPKRTPGGPPIR